VKILKTFLERLRGEQSLNKLIKRGLKIGTNLTRMSGVIIDPSHCWHISVGNNVVLAPNVHILAHDTSTKPFLGYTKVADVNIGNQVFIGAGTIVLPGVLAHDTSTKPFLGYTKVADVNIGNQVFIGAGSVVSKSIPDNSVALGVPAKVICNIDEYLSKERLAMVTENTFDASFTLRNPEFNQSHINSMKVSMAHYKKIFVE